MKEKPNEWVSIADLMAGVMAVVMLLLVMSVLQKMFSDAKHKKEMEQGAASQRQVVSRIMTELKTSIAQQGADGFASFDIEAGKITLRDDIFGRGSACITPQAKSAFTSVEQKIAAFMAEVKGGQIFVEGHTDNLPVGSPVVDFSRFCTVYDDNYTLSAARAREARKLLIGALDSDTARRVVVAGYGDSQPLPNIMSSDGKNRRVEVRFVPPVPVATALAKPTGRSPAQP